MVEPLEGAMMDLFKAGHAAKTSGDKGIDPVKAKEQVLRMPGMATELRGINAILPRRSHPTPA